MGDSDVVYGEYNRRGGLLPSVRCGELDIVGAFQRHLLLVLVVLVLLAILLVACLYYCNAYYKVQAKLIEANIWRRVAKAMRKEEDWKMKAWWEEENNRGQRGERRGRPDGAEKTPRTYVREKTGSRRPAETLGGNLRTSVAPTEMIEMKEFKRESAKSNKVTGSTLQSKTERVKASAGNAPTTEERKISKRPRMPLPGEIDSFYSQPKTDLSSSDFHERLIYDAVEVPEFLSGYRPVGAQVKMINEKMDLGEKQKYDQPSVHGGPKEKFLRGTLNVETNADEILPKTTLDAVPIYSQVHRIKSQQ